MDNNEYQDEVGSRDLIMKQIREFEDVYHLYPSSDLAIEIGLLYDELGNIRTASEYFTKAIELDSNNPRAFYCKAMIFEAEEKIEEAITYYKEAIALDPHYVAAHFFLACIYDDIKEVHLAIYHYERVLELEPDHFYAHLNLGAVYEGLHQDDKAYNYFIKAEAINPHHHLLHFNFGVIYKKRGEYEKSRDAYYRSLSYSTNHPYTYLNLGLLYKDHFNDLHQTIKLYTEGLKHHPEFAVLYYNRGCVYALLEDYDRAIDDLNQALKYDPDLLAYLLEDPELIEIRHFFIKSEK